MKRIGTDDTPLNYLERPSWPFGARQVGFSSLLNNEIRDVFGLFEDNDIKYKRSNDVEALILFMPTGLSTAESVICNGTGASN